jgi:DNA-binding XRE family transcriptional regulator
VPRNSTSAHLAPFSAVFTPLELQNWRGPMTVMHRRIELNWKLRRIAAGLRQQDIALQVGMSASRYSSIERGDIEPTAEDRQEIERALPSLPNDALATSGPS